MCVIVVGAVFHRDRDFQPAIEPSIEIDVVRIDVVEDRAMRHQSQRDCEPAAERFDQARPSDLSPERENARNQPPLATRPF